MKAERVAFQTLFVDPKSFGKDLERCWDPCSCAVAAGGAMCTKVFFMTAIAESGDIAELASKGDASSAHKRMHISSGRCVPLGC